MPEKKYKPPKAAQNNAKKVLRWKKEHGDEVKGMTATGWRRANQLASGQALTLETVKRMASFNRHRKNAKIDPKYKSTPWKDNGYVAWLGWGGTTGINWAMKISKQNMNERLYTFSEVHLEEESMESDVEVLRVGTIQDRGFKITPKMLKDFVKNYKDDVYGTEIQVNCEHRRGSEAMGWVKDLYIKGRKLMATVEWTELGAEKIKKKLFKFVSAELASDYPHHKTGELVDNVFIGLALTNTPALKAQKALSLSEIKKEHMLKKFLSLFSEKEVVTKEEKEALRQAFDELPEEEKEEVREEVEAVEAKPEEAQEEEEKPEGEEAGEEEKEEAPAEEAGEEKAEGELAEKARLTALEEEVRELRKEKLKVQLEAQVEPLMLSETNSKGFIKAKSKGKLVDLLMELSNDHREAVLALFADVVEVTLGEEGSSEVPPEEKSEDEEVADAEKAAEELAAKENISLFEARTRVIREMELKKTK